MRKVMSFVLVSVVAMMFAGCQGMPIPGGEDVDFKEGTNTYSVTERSGKTYTVMNYGDGKASERAVRFNDPKSYDEPMRQSFHVLAKFAKKKGWKYIVLLNTGINNVAGFPINDFRTLKRYVTLHARKKSFATNGTNWGRGMWVLVNGDEIVPWFKPVGKDVKNSYISVWDVDKLYRDTMPKR